MCNKSGYNSLASYYWNIHMQVSLQHISYCYGCLLLAKVLKLDLTYNFADALYRICLKTVYCQHFSLLYMDSYYSINRWWINNVSVSTVSSNSVTVTLYYINQYCIIQYCISHAESIILYRSYYVDHTASNILYPSYILNRSHYIDHALSDILLTILLHKSFHIHHTISINTSQINTVLIDTASIKQSFIHVYYHFMKLK